MTPRLALTTLLLCLCALFAAPDARAQSCTRGTNPVIAFGTVSAIPTVQTDVLANLALTCTGQANRDVKVCVGVTNGSPDTDLFPRQMASGGARIDYQVYQDAARTQVWGTRAGSGSAQALALNARFDNAGRLSLTVPFYGRIFPGQNGLPPGFYSSRMNGSEVTLSYTITAACSTIGGNRRTFRLDANATVPGSCNVNVNDLSFGVRTTLVSAVDASTTMSVTCTVGTAYDIRLDGGVINSDVNNRFMGLDGLPPGVIRYQLYRDAGRSQVWGDTGTTDVNATGTGVPQPFTVYGRVPAQPTPLEAGDYEDSVTATVTY